MLNTICFKFQLGQGALIKVFPSLIKRRKNHFHHLPCGLSVIIGNNGYIWISPPEHTILTEGRSKDEIENGDAQVCFIFLPKTLYLDND